jgi:mannitol-specific phosphotransferase system IIBC component
MTARFVRRIVFGYTIDCFPGLLIVGCNQLKRKLERAGFVVTVSMEPLTALPVETDILIVPSELGELARQAASHSHIEVVDNFLNHPIYNTLIAQFNEGQVWTAARKEPNTQIPDESEGQIVTYQGYQRIG